MANDDIQMVEHPPIIFQETARKLPEAPKPAPEATMTPVLELCQKLRQKTLLSREELVSVTSVL